MERWRSDEVVREIKSEKTETGRAKRADEKRLDVKRWRAKRDEELKR
jgi:hypothetical protein